MKRLISAGLLFILMATLPACSGKADLPKALDKEGIAPYELSEGERYILQSFNMDGTSQIISFHAPKEAIALNVTVYRLEDSGTWGRIGGGGISIGTDRKPMDQLIGTFTMQLKENYTIDFVINAGGRASYKTDEILLDREAVASVKGFLQEFQDITINTEIPVALMVYDSGTSMKIYTLQDYFAPSVFEGMDLVQVVTLEFSDK
ncbi:MAG: hypothetical protein GXX99_08475 [Clostridiales bacterium]|nr:hypothetical protein [Clostridiales bacterium]